MGLLACHVAPIVSYDYCKSVLCLFAGNAGSAVAGLANCSFASRFYITFYNRPGVANRIPVAVGHEVTRHMNFSDALVVAKFYSLLMIS